MFPDFSFRRKIAFVDAEPIFRFSNLLAMAGWVGLVAAPHSRLTHRLVHSGLIPLVLAAVYLVVILVHFGQADGSFATLDGVMTLFSNRMMVLAGWIHYLAFDLFVGAWEVRDARRLGIRHLAVIPSLLLTFMLGPIGLLVWFVTRAVSGKNDAAPAAP